MKRYFLFAALLAVIVSCEDDDSDFSDVISELEAKNAYKEIAFDTTPLVEDEEEYASDDTDYEENSTFSRAVYITYEGSSVSVEGSYSKVTVTADGAHVTVSSTRSGVEYVLSGYSDDGSFKIYSENKIKVTLDGLTLTNPSGAAVNNQCGKSMYVVLADSTENTLTDGTSYTMTAGEDMKGTLFSEGQIIFSGAGTLNVYGNYKNGIVSDDYIVFRPGNVINITNVAGNGIKSNDGISVRGGVLNISATADGAKGINCESNIDISGGRTTIITSGGTRIADGDTTGVAGVKSDMQMLMSGGELNIQSSGEGAKGINCNTDMTYTGGELNIVTLGQKVYSAPKGIKVDGLLDISGGYIYAFSYYSDPVDADGGMTVADGYIVRNEESYLFEIEY